MKSTRNYLAILTFILFLFPIKAFTQDGNGMIIYQIDGNHYIRKNYDANGILKNYQTIEVGKLNSQDGVIESKMTVVSYNKNHERLNASQTIFRCIPKAQKVLIGVFPFAGGKSDKSLRIEMPEGEGPYPAGWRQDRNLQDFNFKLKFKGGIAGFFGTESQVVLSDRKVNPLPNDSYKISGIMTISAFVTGIRISTSGYEYEEVIDPARGIIEQHFRENNGEYFTIELN